MAYESDYFAVPYGLRNQLAFKITRGRDAVREYVIKNHFCTRKALTAIIEASNILSQSGGILVKEGVQAIYDSINIGTMRDAGLIDENLKDLPDSHWNKEKIKVIESAKKQAPKLLKILKGKNFFQNIKINS